MTSTPGPFAPPPPAPPVAPPPFAVPPHPAPDAGGSTRRRRGLRTALVAVPALLVVAGAASFITVLVDGHGHTVAGSGTAAGTAATTSKHATVGTLTAQNGSTWVVRTASGRTVKVDVGAKTTYGTKAHPTPASAFHTGADVKIVGAGTGSTLDAKRVVLVTTSGTTT